MLKRKENLKNKRFRNLVVLNETYINSLLYWNCLCVCGNRAQCKPQALKQGKSTHCKGCPVFSKKRVAINIKDYEFKEVCGINILNCINPKDSAKKRKYRAICKCGIERVVTQYNILYRKKLQCKECGWKDVGLSKEKKESGINRVFIHYKKGAERRNICFELSKQEVFDIVTKNCSYCGKAPSMLATPLKGVSYKNQFFYSSIDRIDSNLGYIKENCTSSCKECNYAKQTMTVQEYKEFIARVFNFLNKST